MYFGTVVGGCSARLFCESNILKMTQVVVQLATGNTHTALRAACAMQWTPGLCSE